ncbi:TPA: hypothetical protein N0F65_006091 [Lagenidium giganteum]|uniref:Uncharacterized protein n=1 Tax=Lagenidium giganteum TaxID=4803 RepID=A0AAV2Z3C5_9STRA|nr:TPA: hypothetical protein N0F65_006091 [Lagenidium giganteum]
MLETSGECKYSSWYPELFYQSTSDSGKRDVLVVDIHTDTPSVEDDDPGGVLNWGVGDVHFGFFIVDGITYAGPLFGSYEFVTPINERLTDKEFESKLPDMISPEWTTESFLCEDVRLPTAKPVNAPLPLDKANSKRLTGQKECVVTQDALGKAVQVCV